MKAAYRNYVEHVLLRVNTRTGRRYADEPAILAWELANEPRSVSADGNPLPGGADVLLGWVDEMSSFIRSVDSNHLIGVGDEGYFRHNLAFGNNLYNGAFGVDCERLLGLRNIDFGTCHLYPDFVPNQPATEFGSSWIRDHIEAGQRANKPMLIEEYGLKIDATGPSRDTVFETWLQTVTASGGAGALLWMIAGQGSDMKRYPDYDHYTVYSAEDVPSVCAFARTAPVSARVSSQTPG